ncbi:MAG: protein translocase subunit SecF, partial [Cellvibrionaceae bacterium]
MSEKLSNLNINFMGQRKTAATLSAIFLLASLVALLVNGLNLGLDFTGGTQVRLDFQRSVNLDTVRGVMAEQGFSDSVVVYYGSESEVLIRFQGSMEEIAVVAINADLEELAPGARVQSTASQAGAYQSEIVISDIEDANAVAEALFPRAIYGAVEVGGRREEGTLFRLQGNIADPVTDSLIAALAEATDRQVQLQDLSYVGSQVGDEMAENAVIGLLTALALVMMYVALRFQYKFAVGAVAALIHDVLIVVGVFAIFQMDVDLTVFAAVLAVIGYSLNDTIVVSDRIRENFRKIR